MKVLDMHCDTISRLYYGDDCDPQDDLLQNRVHIDLGKMKRGDYLLQNFALFVDTGNTDNPFETAMEMTDRYYRELEKNSDRIAPVYRFADIAKNQAEGKMSSLLTLEEGGILKGRMEYLRIFYRLGIRMIALTWNYENEIGYPNLIFQEGILPGAEEKMMMPAFERRCSRGFKEFGIDLVQMMEELGIIIDVSHLSDGGFHDVVEYTEKPFVASHSNAAGVCNVSRNLTDDMIRILAERGGVMGINFAGCFLTPMMASDPFKDYTGTIVDMIQHIRHIINVGGIEVCALGSDFDGIPGNPEIADASQMQKLALALEKDGFTETETEQIFYKNAMRVYREIL